MNSDTHRYCRWIFALGTFLLLSAALKDCDAKSLGTRNLKRDVDNELGSTTQTESGGFIEKIELNVITLSLSEISIRLAKIEEELHTMNRLSGIHGTVQTVKEIVEIIPAINSTAQANSSSSDTDFLQLNTKDSEYVEELQRELSSALSEETLANLIDGKPAGADSVANKEEDNMRFSNLLIKWIKSDLDKDAASHHNLTLSNFHK